MGRVEKEKWEQIPGFEGLYWASSYGRISSNYRIRALKEEAGYKRVTLSKNGKKTSYRVHRLVLAAFLGPSDEICVWLDGNTTNNKLENLRYGHRGNPVIRQTIINSKGDEFPSLSEAARSVGLKIKDISYAIQNGVKVANLFWKYKT